MKLEVALYFYFYWGCPHVQHPRRRTQPRRKKRTPVHKRGTERLVWKEVEQVVHGGACEAVRKAEIIVVRSAEVLG